MKAKNKVSKLGVVQKLGSRALSFAAIFTVSVIVFAPFSSLNSSMLLTIIAVILAAVCCFVNTDWGRITLTIFSVILAFFVVRYFQKGAFTFTVYKVVMGLIIFAELGVIRYKSIRFSENGADPPTELLDGEGETTDGEAREKTKYAVKLIPTREYDLERLETYFYVDSVIGVNGAWGTGKTFLVDEFVRRLKGSGCHDQSDVEKDTDPRRCEWKNAEIIRLGLFELNSGDNANSIVTVFFNAFDNRLRKNNYLSRRSEAMSVLMGNHHFLEDLRVAVSPDHESIDEAVEQMRSTLSSLPVRVIIIIEDIDRLRSPEKIRAVFSICERFAGDRIRVIIEFSSEMLQRIDKSFTYAFVEKFVPDMVNLTPITFQEAADFFLGKDYAADNLFEQMSEAVTNLNQNAYSSRIQFETLFQRFGIRIKQINEHDDKYADSVRSVVNFLKELRLWLEYENNREEGKQYSSNKHVHELRIRAISSIIFMKHMDHEVFERIELFQSPLDTFGFTAVVEDDNTGNKDSKDSRPIFYNVKRIKELSAGLGGKVFKTGDNKQEIQKYSEAFSDAMNSDPVVINMFRDLYILGYYMPGVKATPEQQRRAEYDNEEIDRVIQNFLANGTSEYTRDENFVNELNKAFDEANGSSDRLADAFEKVWSRYYDGKTYKYSGTIFRFGDNIFARIAQAYLLAEHRQAYWIKLIDFFDAYQNDEVGPGKFEQLYYCGKFKPHYGEPDVFIKCIKLFLKWSKKLKEQKEQVKEQNVVSELAGSDGNANFNNDEWYMRFLAEYIDNLYSYGFTSYEGIEYGSLDRIRTVNENPEIVKTTLDYCNEALGKRRDRYKNAGLNGLAKDYDLLLSFITENERIIENDRPYKAPPHTRTEIHEVYVHKNEGTFNKLKDSGTAEEIDKAFANGEINAAEADMLLNAQEEKMKGGEPECSSLYS